MAPVSSPSPIDLPAYLSTLSLSELESLNSPPLLEHIKRDDLSISSRSEPTNPLNVLTHLVARGPAPPTKTAAPDHRGGAVAPTAINMAGIQALFAIIGAAFVLASIWFFFWAKNGGFQWRKGDWEDYKSTVLRRKGPDGKTLSNATKSTRLGGGSVVASGYSDEGMTELSSEAPIIQEKANSKRGNKGMRGGGGKPYIPKGNQESKKAAKQRAQKEESWEGGFDHDVRAYRHEKPAQVGGLNRDSDTHYHGTDYSQTHSQTHSNAYSPTHSQTSQTRHNQNHSNTHSHHSSRQPSPTKTPRPPRHDFSNSNPHSNSHSHDHNNNPNTARYHSPSKPPSEPRSRVSMPGSYVEPLDFDASSASASPNGAGTKSYHHPIPGLSKGFRASGGNGNGNGNGNGGNGSGRNNGRARRDSLDDSD